MQYHMYIIVCLQRRYAGSATFIHSYASNGARIIPL